MASHDSFQGVQSCDSAVGEFWALSQSGFAHLSCACLVVVVVGSQ